MLSRLCRRPRAFQHCKAAELPLHTATMCGHFAHTSKDRRVQQGSQSAAVISAWSRCWSFATSHLTRLRCC